LGEEEWGNREDAESRRDVETVIVPPCWVFLDVATDAFQINAVADDLLVIPSLPHFLDGGVPQTIDASRLSRFISTNDGGQRA
jgi:hypothetical protein